MKSESIDKQASGQSVNVPDSANNAPTETNDDVPF